MLNFFIESIFLVAISIISIRFWISVIERSPQYRIQSVKEVYKIIYITPIFILIAVIFVIIDAITGVNRIMYHMSVVAIYTMITFGGRMIASSIKHHPLAS